MVDGILNVDKPPGWTSHDVVQWVRRLSGQKRVGHAGTLDPMAVGVLLVCLGQATRVVDFLQQMPKQYLATIRLGVGTDSYDATGQVVARKPLPVLSTVKLEEALTSFRGEILQVPPMFSALKYNGQPLYRLARAGKSVRRRPRPVTIYRLELLSWQPPDLSVRVRCSAGTYIRSLAHDLGQTLGCGGHLAVLVREAIGPFTREEAVAPSSLEGAPDWRRFLLPLDLALADLPRLEANVMEAKLLRHGQVPFSWGKKELPGRWVRVYHNGTLLALVEWQAEKQRWHAAKVFRAASSL